MQVEDQPTVDSFLHSLGLDKYAINFKAEEVNVLHLLVSLFSCNIIDLLISSLLILSVSSCLRLKLEACM